METLRQITHADLPGAWQVCAAAMSDEALTLPVLTEKLFDPLTSADTYSLACFVDGKMAGLCCGTEIPWKGVGGIRLLAVSPEFQNRGIGQRLLVEVEKALFYRPGVRSLTMMATQGNYLIPGIDPNNQRAIRFIGKRGYQMIDTAHHLIAEAGVRSSAQDRFELAAKAGYRLARASVEDSGSLLRFVHAIDPGWEPEVRRAHNNTPSTVHVAYDVNDVVAFCCSESNNVGTGVLGPYAVSPDHRRKGLGCALLHCSVDDLAALNFAQYRLCWTNPLMDRFFIQEFSARLDREFLIFEKRRT